MLGACIAKQIEDLYNKCEYGSPIYNSTQCNAYEADPANAACASCMYSVEGDATYGAVVTLKDRYRFTDVGGCIALVDGDMSATGCGAREWASVLCDHAACTGCPDDNTYSACETVAQRTICSSYYQASVCADRPAYAGCHGFGTYRNYFLALGAVFCSTGLNASADGGRDSGIGDSADEGGSADASGQ